MSTPDDTLTPESADTADTTPYARYPQPLATVATEVEAELLCALRAADLDDEADTCRANYRRIACAFLHAAPTPDDLAVGQLSEREALVFLREQLTKEMERVLDNALARQRQAREHAGGLWRAWRLARAPARQAQPWGGGTYSGH